MPGFILSIQLAAAMSARLRHLCDRGNRRHSRIVNQEKYVMAWRREIAVDGARNSQATGSLLKGQRHITRVLIEKVGRSAGPNQDHLRDAFVVGSGNRKIGAILNLCR